MTHKKTRQLIILNAFIVILNIALFSNALLGLKLFTGPLPQIAIAWGAILISLIVFIKGNSEILRKREIRLLTQNIQSLDGCIPVFKEALHNGDVFDDNIRKNIDQINRFKRKQDTIKDLLTQKFSPNELSYRKFTSVLQDVDSVVYMNMRGILNKIAAFDTAEYETMQRRGIHDDRFSQEKWDIYNEYIRFVDVATRTNEDIILKLDKMLLEISRFNTLGDSDIQKLPAIIEMDELIKNAKLYK